MRKWWEGMVLFAPDKAGGGNGDGAGDKGNDKDKGAGDKKGDGTGDQAPTFDQWLSGQDAKTKELLSEHTQGLRKALGTERDARKDAEKDLRAVADKLEKGSEAQKEVLRLADEGAAETVKAEFYEDAHEAGIVNLKLAYHVAITDELFDKRGNVDFEKMKVDFPELFGKAPRKPPGGAGDGAGDDLGQPASMNAFIRRQAGRE